MVKVQPDAVTSTFFPLKTSNATNLSRSTDAQGLGESGESSAVGVEGVDDGSGSGRK